MPGYTFWIDDHDAITPAPDATRDSASWSWNYSASCFCAAIVLL
jgi:hypothetical protein